MQYAGMDPGLEVGGAAPHFSLPNQFGEPVSLLELHGTAVALVFYPFAFSGVCTRELNELQENSGMFANAGVHLLAASVDSKYTLRSYAQAEGYSFDLLADFWPHGKVAASYGVFDPVRGMARRSTFLISAAGIIVDFFSTPAGQARPLGRYVQALGLL